VVAAAELDVVAAGDDVELELLLLPQPTARADTAIELTTAEIRRGDAAFSKMTSPCLHARILAS